MVLARGVGAVVVGPQSGWDGIPGADTPALSPQKPILLQGHERSITQIKYNREGDLLFTVAKDPVSGGAREGDWVGGRGTRRGEFAPSGWWVNKPCRLRGILLNSTENRPYRGSLAMVGRDEYPGRREIRLCGGGTGRGSTLVTRGWEEPERTASTVWRIKLIRGR